AVSLDRAAPDVDAPYEAFAPRAPEPLLRAHARRRVEPPLAGVRVVHLGVGAVVPELCGLLGELGAEVIKIESRASLDFLRQVTFERDRPNRSSAFNTECRGHEGVC